MPEYNCTPCVPASSSNLIDDSCAITATFGSRGSATAVTTVSSAAIAAASAASAAASTAAFVISIFRPSANAAAVQPPPAQP